jgi:uncharacterized protein
MKYLIWLLIVLAGIWWIRKQRQPQEPNNKNHPTPNNTQPTAMLPCVHCGVLCPENDTVTGKLGRYCSDAHRQSHEG